MNLNVDTTQLKAQVLNFIVPLICLGAAILLGVFVIYPSYVNIPIYKAKLVTAQELDEQLLTKLRNLNKLLDFKTIVNENSQLFEKALVGEPSVPQLLTQVDRIAKKSGLTVARLSYSFSGVKEEADQVSGQINYINVNLSALGSYAQMVDFMQNLENSARVVNVESLRFAQEKVDSANVLGMTFILKSPYMYVKSNAVTDDPINIDITSSAFTNMAARVKKLTYYQISPNEVIEAKETTPSKN